jgi:hypothetical protein
VLRPRAGIARGTTLAACSPGLHQWHHHFDERTVVVMVVHVRRGEDENHRRQPMSALDPYPGLSPILHPLSLPQQAQYTRDAVVA